VGIPIPWWAKIAAKIILARLPIGYEFWQKVGLFRHGAMDEIIYVQHVFDWHVASAGLINQLEGKTLLELGPGNSVATAVVAACYGANTILIDSGDYASQDISLYRRFTKSLKEAGLRPPNLEEAQNREEALKICGAKYLSNGLSSLKAIADDSVDLIFSHAVLEHVRRHEFFEATKECSRILKVGGWVSHRVDLKDHLGGGLNNLRFRKSVWESDFFVRSGFYTNRLRFSEMIALFERAGFYLEMVNVGRWNVPPIERKSLSQDFESLTDDDLIVKEFDVLMRLL
jgi:SAM-dependent methyltransferase